MLFLLDFMNERSQMCELGTFSQMWSHFMLLFVSVVLATLPELCYITTMLMGQGDTLLRTTMHGIVLNILHSLTMLPELSHSGEFLLYTIC